MPWDVNLICSVTTLINFSQHLYVKDQVHGCEKHKRTALTCLCSSPFFPEKMWPCRYAFPAGGLKPSPLHTSHPLPGPRWAGGALLPGYWQGSRWRRRSEDINKDETWFVFFFPRIFRCRNGALLSLRERRTVHWRCSQVILVHMLTPECRTLGSVQQYYLKGKFRGGQKYSFTLCAEVDLLWAVCE